MNELSNLETVSKYYGFSKTSDLIRIARCDYPQPLTIKQLSNSISNAEVIAYVLRKSAKKLYTNYENISEQYIIICIRDKEDTCLVYCWGQEMVMLCSKIQVGCLIKLEFPNIKTKKQNALPTTCDFDLHFGERTSKVHASNPLTYHKNPTVSIIQGPCPFDLTHPLCTHKFTPIDNIIQDLLPIGVLCNIICLVMKKRSSYTVVHPEGGVVHRTIRCLDSSNIKAYLIISAWGEDCSLFDTFEENDIIVLERVRITKWKSTTQVTIGWSSLVHVNPAIPEREALKSWLLRDRLCEESPSKKVKLITDFYAPVKIDGSTNSHGSENQVNTRKIHKQRQSSPLNENKILKAVAQFPKLKQFYTVSELSKMDIGECRITLAMISHIQLDPKNTSSLKVIRNRSNFEIDEDDPFKPINWTYDVEISIIDHTYSIEHIPVQDQCCIELLGMSSSSFIMHDNQREILSSKLWNRYEIHLSKVSVDNTFKVVRCIRWDFQQQGSEE